MINLLPNDYRQSLRYARRNSMLLKWLLGILIALSLLVTTVVAGLMFLRLETNRYTTITQNTRQELKDQNLEETLNKVQNISSNLKLIVQVLSKQVVFSGLIKQIGSVMPTDTILSNIEISKIDAGIDLTAYAKSYNDATQIQVNLSDPNNKLFDKVDIISVNCIEDTKSVKYPCTVSLRAQFTKNNPYLFVNQNKKAAQ